MFLKLGSSNPFTGSFCMSWFIDIRLKLKFAPFVRWKSSIFARNRRRCYTVATGSNAFFDPKEAPAQCDCEGDVLSSVTWGYITSLQKHRNLQETTRRACAFVSWERSSHSIIYRIGLLVWKTFLCNVAMDLHRLYREDLWWGNRRDRDKTKYL